MGAPKHKRSIHVQQELILEHMSIVHQEVKKMMRRGVVQHGWRCLRYAFATGWRRQYRC